LAPAAFAACPTPVAAELVRVASDSVTAKLVRVASHSVTGPVAAATMGNGAGGTEPSLSLPLHDPCGRRWSDVQSRFKEY